MEANKKNFVPPDGSRVPICAIGASAGGVEALREFFGALPNDLGIAYVVVVHLAPHHESELSAIIGRKTGMDVVEIDDNKKLDLKPNCVYVIAPETDGYEVARRLRGEPWGKDLTLVALSGWGQEEHRRRAQEAGFDRHVTKPADLAALQSVLNGQRGSAPQPPAH